MKEQTNNYPLCPSGAFDCPYINKFGECKLKSRENDCDEWQYYNEE